MIFNSWFRLWVNFTNVLRATFSYQSVFQSFSLLTVWLYKFLGKRIGAKAACKMLVKIGVNFMNISWAVLVLKFFWTAVMLLRFGFEIFCWKEFGAKAACKMFVKFDHRMKRIWNVSLVVNKDERTHLEYCSPLRNRDLSGASTQPCTATWRLRNSRDPVSCRGRKRPDWPRLPTGGRCSLSPCMLELANCNRNPVVKETLPGVHGQNSLMWGSMRHWRSGRCRRKQSWCRRRSRAGRDRRQRTLGLWPPATRWRCSPCSSGCSGTGQRPASFEACSRWRGQPARWPSATRTRREGLLLMTSLGPCNNISCLTQSLNVKCHLLRKS